MVDKTTAAASPEASKPTESGRKEPSQGQSASIGPSITINGDVTGEENLVVEGVVEGGADAVLAASIFHFGEHTVAEAKQTFLRAGVTVRPHDAPEVS